MPVSPDDGWIGASAQEQAQAVSERRVTAEALARLYIERIERLDGKLGAFVHVDAEAALSAAYEIDKRCAAGGVVLPLAGVAFAVKDNAHVAGMPTRLGSAAFGDSAQPHDDPITARLRAAGGVVLGKTSMPELGMHSATSSETFGLTRNPWNLDHTPGGSSGGSAAAVAAGLASIATGSDGGGSIRTPAAFCGLVGLKPTTSLVPRSNGDSALTALGFLTRTVAETARLLDVAGGAHPCDRGSVSMAGERFETALTLPLAPGLRIVWSPDLGYAPIEPEIEHIARRAFDRLLMTAPLESIKMTVILPNIYQAWVQDAFNFALEDLHSKGVRIQHLDKRTRRLLDIHSRSDPSVYLEVRRAFAEIERQAAKLFSEVDILATPSTACEPFGAGSEIPSVIAGRAAEWTGAEPLSMFVNVLGAPAISVPAGVTGSGLPVGLQLVARRFEDRTLLQLAHMLERASPWLRLAPDYA